MCPLGASIESEDPNTLEVKLSRGNSASSAIPSPPPHSLSVSREVKIDIEYRSR